MPRLLMLRHAQSTWNAEGRWQGHADPPLSAEGKQTAKAAAPQYSHIARFVSSPLQRARETAEIIAESSGAGPITIYPGIAERDLGEWEGLTRGEVEEGWPEYLQEHRWPESAETTEAFQERVLATIGSIAEEIAAEESKGDVLVIAHAGVIIALEQSLGEEWRKIGNLCGRAVIADGDKLSLGEQLVFETDLFDGDLFSEIASSTTLGMGR